MSEFEPAPVAEPSGPLPRLVVDTDDGLDPATRNTYVHGSYRLVTPGDDERSGRLRIRGRGNSTWNQPKRPWRIKFDEPIRPPGMHARQRNWALLAEWFDRSRMDNYVAFTLGQHMSGFDWTPQYRYVSLTLNGTYRGLYGLADLVRMEAGRVPGTPMDDDAIPGTADWLFEAATKERPMSTDSADDWGFTTPVRSVWVEYKGYHHPDFRDQCYAEDLFDAFEAALATRDWRRCTELADMTSFADWWLVNEFISNTDAATLYSSCKMHTRDGHTLVMGPMWDQDLSLGVGWKGFHSAHRWWLYGRTPWFDDLFTIPEWVTLIQTRWDVLKTVVTRELPGGSVDGFFDSTAQLIRPYAEADDAAWGTSPWDGHSTTFADAVTRRKRWVAERLDWFDGQIHAL